ncbi:MAG: glycosyltransferase family 9 protein [Verrucomicrobia bacterium]|nr:glycosyltransferase family 9 protein [Verrucomicrobiota bacterium]MDA1087453.1 glycosyltransferase family 9 protein [Verrucomicrobiota bacterium]
MVHGLPNSPRILIIKLSSLGDVIHAMPTVNALYRELKPSCIHWVAQPEYHELISCCPNIQRTIPFYRRSFFVDLNPWLKALRSEAYDLVIDLQGIFKSSLNALVSRATRRVGPARSREGARMLYHDTVQAGDVRRHAVDLNLDVLDYLGLERGVARFDMQLPPADLDAPAPRVGIAPFSRHAYKNWPQDDFRRVASRLQDQYNATIIFVGSRDDAPACEAMRGALGSSTINMAGRTSLVELASLLGDLDVLISNDSGPMHIASAVGTPVVGLFTGTDPCCYGPYGDRHRVLSALDGDDISVQSVATATGEILARG